MSFLEIYGLIAIFLKGEQSIIIATTEISGFILYFLGHILLFWRRKDGQSRQRMIPGEL